MFWKADMMVLLLRTVSPLTLLKNPMVLIGVLGLAFVMGMPYLMDSSMFIHLSTPHALLFASFPMSFIPLPPTLPSPSHKHPPPLSSLAFLIALC